MEVEDIKLDHPAYLVEGWTQDSNVSQTEMEYMCKERWRMETSGNLKIGENSSSLQCMGDDPKCDWIPDLDLMEKYMNMIATKTELDYKLHKIELDPSKYLRIHYCGIKMSAMLENDDTSELENRVRTEVGEKSKCGIFGFNKHMFVCARKVGMLEILMFIGVDMRSKGILFFDDIKLNRGNRRWQLVEQMKRVIDNLANDLSETWYKAGKMELWNHLKKVRPGTR